MTSKNPGEKLQRLLDRLVARDEFVVNAVLGVAGGDQGFKWSGAAGSANPGDGYPMKAETPFFIASVTKLYTAAAVMKLHESGKLSLDDRISRHLPGDLIPGIHRYQGTDYTDTLAVRHLIGQTSGLPDYFLQKPKQGTSLYDRLINEGDLEWDTAEAVRIAREALSPRFPPADFGESRAVPSKRTGLKAFYADTNYQLLGTVIESAAERPLQEVYEEFFFGPLNLENTYLHGFSEPRSFAGEEPARMYFKKKPLNLDKAMKSFWADGGLVSTVSDSLRFLQAFMTGILFENEGTLPAMKHWNRIFFPMEYGYGIMRFKLPRILSLFNPSPELIGHSGASGSFLFFCPERDLYLAGTINQTARQGAPFRLMLKAVQLFDKRN